MLKKALDDIPRLRRLPYDYQTFKAFKLWLAKVETIIKEGLEDDDYERLDSVQSKYFPDELEIDNLSLAENFSSKLNDYEVALESIIQKYEILGIEPEVSVTRVSPESISRLEPPEVFISHGKESVALRKLEEFIETLGIKPLIVKNQASLDKDVPDKVNLYLNQADFVIILATGDDTLKDKKTGTEIIQPRQNVIHEIGLAQETHPGRIIYLLEEGADFPSNIRPRVWENFKRRNMMDAFLGVVRELRAYGILKVSKFPTEEHPKAK